ncbi:Hypothetical protein OINT_2001739 [Brucella intermedia LMG 3301]|uniref:Uncharacterized protein n=1 Tax=Brucella intermedia LMG 3301 TaxID=641118 RepID=C4WQJ9_9HYPH|nr:Hypothetical protein OINT_2001739 [Brucella intermedia LMG 3301]
MAIAAYGIVGCDLNGRNGGANKTRSDVSRSICAGK